VGLLVCLDLLLESLNLDTVLSFSSLKLIFEIVRLAVLFKVCVQITRELIQSSYTSSQTLGRHLEFLLKSFGPPG
jgi:hypothetical protein